MKVRRAFVWVVLAVVAGCAAVPGEDGEGPAVEAGAAEEKTEGVGMPEEDLVETGIDEKTGDRGDRVETPETAREVLVPRGAEWLAEVLEAEYAGVAASVALRQVTRGRPLRLDVGGLDPLVGSQPGAVTVQDHVRSICAQADWSCNAVGGVLVVSDMETRTIPVAVQPGISTSEIRLRALAGDAGEGGDGDENAVEVVLAPYADEVVALVRTVLGLGDEDDGGEGDGEGAAAVDPRTSVVALPSANAVAVSARPHRMRAVERALERFNAAAAKTVRLHVAVYEVDSRGESESGVDLVALREAAVGLGLRVTGGSATGEGAVAAVTFLEGNRTDGSRVVLRWLNTTGTAEVRLDETVEARNNSVALVAATETRQFVVKVSQASALVGAALTAEAPEVEFDELRLGWSVALQPTVVDDEVTVRVALSRRALVEERAYSFADGAIEGTNFVTDDFDRLMSVSLRSGETKLLTSLVNTAVRASSRGIPWLGWLGRGRTTEERKREVVLMMTAEVL